MRIRDDIVLPKPRKYVEGVDVYIRLSNFGASLNHFGIPVVKRYGEKSWYRGIFYTHHSGYVMEVYNPEMTRSIIVHRHNVRLTCPTQL